ncbi:MAG TPA: hypothetical protein VK357_09635 [Rubrobacteraceae bacterium]|nr:hypothetical protein [Rubrobacteraceae bacterium]
MSCSTAQLHRMPNAGDELPYVVKSNSAKLGQEPEVELALV